MSALFAALRENHPPSTVHLSATGRFRALDEENLVLARSTSLEVYAMRFPDEVQPPNSSAVAGAAAAADSAADDKKERRPVLQCVGRYDLYGHVEAMALIKLPGKERDCLVLVFRDAKMSVVEYSPAADELTTAAIFMFEDEELKRGRVTWALPPVLRIDPRRRCIALLVYETKLIIIPIRHAGEGDLDDDLAAQDDILVQPNKKFKGENATAQGVTRLGAAPPDASQLGFLPSYLIDLDEAHDLHGARGIKGVTDFTFLEGYYEPTLCFLHENKRTWVGRLAVTHHTKMITTISLNLSQKRHPCIWGAGRIPHDCKYLKSLPAPVGGVVVVSSTAILYRNHGQRCALKLNDYATAAGDGGHRYDTAEEPMLLETVHPVRLDGYQFLFSLRNTDFYVLNIQLDTDGNTVKGLGVDRVQSVVDVGVGSATTMARLGDEYLFVGARLGDSALFQIYKAPKSSLSLNDKKAVEWLSNVVSGPGLKEEAGQQGGQGALGANAVTVMAGDGAFGDKEEVVVKVEATDKPVPSTIKVNGADSSDDELYGVPASASAPAAPEAVTGDDSDDELYATAGGGGAGGGQDNGVGGGGASMGPVGGFNEEEMDEEDAAIYAVARTENTADVTVEKSETMVYALKQRDKLLGFGPVGDFLLCPHRPKLDEVRKDSIDVLTSSGAMGQTKVCTMHRSLNPVVTTAVSLPNAHAVWTVYGHEGDDLEALEGGDGGDVGGGGERMHAYMIISEGGDEPGTVVLKGNELEEFEEGETMDFHTSGETVCVGNLFNNRRIVQVTPWKVLLLKGAVMDQEVPFVAGAGGQIVAAWVCDPYIALLLQDGRLNLLVGDETTFQVLFVMWFATYDVVCCLAGLRRTSPHAPVAGTAREPGPVWPFSDHDWVYDKSSIFLTPGSAGVPEGRCRDKRCHGRLLYDESAAALQAPRGPSGRHRDAA